MAMRTRYALCHKDFRGIRTIRKHRGKHEKWLIHRHPIQQITAPAVRVPSHSIR